jgi:hypothetical protein
MAALQKRHRSIFWLHCRTATDIASQTPDNTMFKDMPPCCVRASKPVLIACEADRTKTVHQIFLLFPAAIYIWLVLLRPYAHPACLLFRSFSGRDQYRNNMN